MAREVVVLNWCDICMSKGHKEPATSSETIVMSSLKGAALSLDLCDADRKELLDDLMEALREHGARAETPAPRERVGSKKHVVGPFYCLVVGCVSRGQRGYANSGSLGAHLRTSHELTIGEYRERYGLGDDEYGPTSPPLDGGGAVQGGRAAVVAPRRVGDSSVGFDEEFPCRADGCDVVYSKSLGHNMPKQARGMHEAKKHGIRSAASLAKNGSKPKPGETVRA